MQQQLGSSHRHRFVSSLTMLAIVTSLVVAGSPASQAVNFPQTNIVNPNPENWTPNVLDGQINSIVQIGTKVYAAGRFTQVQAASGGTIYARTNIFAFDATNGAIDTTFAPTFNDIVKALAVSPDGNLFVGGYFTSVNGEASINRLVKLNPTTGQRITAFSANANGQVWDIAVSGTRLFVGGRFTSIKNVARDRLAALNTTTGAVDPNVSFTITDPHTSTSVPWVYSFDVSPDGSKLVIIGNFMKVNTQPRPQAAMIDLSTTPASLANWQTDRYVPPCFSNAFDTYMRDVNFSPDGSYFVIVSTGGPNFGTLCDTAARWESNAQGAALQPTWVDATGGDTLSAVAVTGAAVYVGGHQRWLNNWYGSDRPGAGAVDRPGIAALDPVNGLPFSWNPGRDRGVGVFALYSTSAGLWMGHDTDTVAGETRKKLAFFPLLGGKTPPPTDPYTLPGDLYNVPISSCAQVDPSILYRVHAGGPEVAAVDCGPNWVADDSSGAPGAAFRNTGSNNVSSWNQQFTVDNTVPSTTPSTIFDSERWDPGSLPEMQWHFPVPLGTHVTVRLYFINQCGCTSGVGQRVFNVAIDGSTVLDHYDIVAGVGDRVGTMKSFNIPSSDGNVNIDFAHVTENPLINGIEIVNADVPPGPGPGAIGYLPRRTLDGNTLGVPSNLETPGTDWSSTRGIFALQGMLYNGSSNGNFYARTFDGTRVGPAQPINLNGLSDFPVQSLSGLVYANGRIYYTVKGDAQMYYRYFTPESQIVGSDHWSVGALTPPVDWSSVRGMTLANGKLYFARADGNLYSMDFANGAPVGGTETLVSPKSDGYDWASNGLFAFTHVTVDIDPPSAPGKPAGQSPVTGTITINWAASTDASPPITYRIYRDGNQVGTSTSTSFTDTAPGILTPGSSHIYTVDAIDSVGNPPSQMSPDSDPIVVASAIFSDDFSSNDFSKWSGVTRLTIDNSTGGVAAPSARGAVTAQTAFAYKTLSGTFSTVCMSGNVNVAVRDAVSTNLLMLRTAGNGPIVRVFVNANGILYLRSDVSNAQIYSGVALGTGFHKLEVCGTVGASSSWDLYRDGSKIVTLVANTGTTDVGRANIGNTQAVTATINFDDIVVDQTPG